MKERQYVFEVKLPAKGLLKLRSNLATLLAKDGIVTRLTFNSGIMPLEEAHQAALEISTMMNLQTDRIAAWHKEASMLKGPKSCLLTTFTYPKIEISIRTSLNTLYPYKLSASIHWSDRLGGAGKGPPPFPEPMTISMDPPSGKIYDPAEMWGDPEDNRRQMEEWMKRNPDKADRVRKELAAQEEEYRAKPSSADTNPPLSRRPLLPPLPEAERPSHGTWWKWLLAALATALAAGGLLAWKRKRR